MRLPSVCLATGLLSLTTLAAQRPWTSAPLVSGAEPAVRTAPGAAPAEDELPDAERTVEVAELGLRLVLPPIDGRQGELSDAGQRWGFWRGTLGGAPVRITLWVLGRGENWFSEPQGVTALIRDNLEGQDQPLEYLPQEYVPGPFGFVPYGSLQPMRRYESTAVTGHKWVLGGILQDGGYALEVDLDAVPDESQRSVIESFLRSGVTYSGEVRDAQWTEEEIEARMAADLPSSLDEERNRWSRTEHYIFFGNASADGAFARKLEEYYEVIRETFPFPEVEGQRLLPIFLFRTRDQYIDFLVEKLGMDRTAAGRTGGIASGDWYATTYQHPNDSTHIHELTHQIFGNRLMLSGGGSWFQEGVAVFVETVHYKQEANGVKNVGKRVGKDGAEDAAAAGQFIRFKKLFAQASMLFSNSGATETGDSAAGQAYNLAGSVIYFVMNDKRTRDRAQEFVHKIGSVRRNDVPAIERVLGELFDTDVQGFEDMYVEFWKKGR
jgi:hypothetical protein